MRSRGSSISSFAATSSSTSITNRKRASSSACSITWLPAGACSWATRKLPPPCRSACTAWARTCMRARPKRRPGRSSHRPGTDVSHANRPLNVLVVDDSAVMRQVMTTVLSREPGLLVETAAHPLIASGKMKQKRPDVIVLDIEMPYVDGLTFLQQIMAEEPIPVLVCSALAKGGADTVLRALEYG